MIVVDHVSKYYGTHCAVRELSFRIAEGECVGFLGLNGAGKSTTLRLLSCLLLPTSGRVTVRGFDAEESPNEIRKLIGYLPDNPPLYPEMTVREYLVFAGKLRGMETTKVADRLPEVLKTCGLTEMADKSIGALSHGYQQRVGIAQAIVHDPTLLILDEPLQGLDPVQIVEMREMIRALRGRHTILLSTHMLSEIEQTCDRILMMHDGRITAEGSEEELAAKHGGGGSVELEIRAERDAVLRALAGIEGIGEPEVAPVSAGVVRVRLRMDREAREEVARAVVRADLGLLAMRRVSGGLESIFVRLTKARDLERKPPEAAQPRTSAEEGAS